MTKEVLVIADWYDRSLYSHLQDFVLKSPYFEFVGKEKYESIGYHRVEGTLNELTEALGDTAIKTAKNLAKEKNASLVFLWGNKGSGVPSRGVGTLEVAASFYRKRNKW